MMYPDKVSGGVHGKDITLEIVHDSNCLSEIKTVRLID